MRGLIQEVKSLSGVMTSKPVWLCGVALTLWGLNALSLQSVRFEHRGTIAISHSRLAALEAIANDNGRGTPYQFLDCGLCPDEATSLHQSDMRTVRLRVRAKSHSDLLNLDEYLLEATKPAQDSPESLAILREIRNSNWVHEALLHQQTRIREERAALNHSDPDPDLHDSDLHAGGVSPPTFQLVAHRLSSTAETTDPDEGHEPQSPQGKLIELSSLESALAAQQQVASLQLETLSERLAASRANNEGYLSFTGAQESFPVAMPVGWDRMVVAASISMSAWCLVALFVQRFPALFAYVQGRMQQRVAGRADRHRKSESLDMGIPCLGTIEIASSPVLATSQAGHGASVTSPTEATEATEGRSPRSFNRPSGASKPSFVKPSLLLEEWLQNAATLAIATWALIFGIRFLVDDVWRTLFLASPLAGLLHLLTGAP